MEMNANVEFAEVVLKDLNELPEFIESEDGNELPEIIGGEFELPNVITDYNQAETLRSYAGKSNKFMSQGCDKMENAPEDVKNKYHEVDDSAVNKIEKSIGTPEGIRDLIARHPEKIELWESQMKALDTLNDVDASPAEIRSAQAKLSILKGQLLETAVKDALTDAGLEVEAQQRVLEGESGATRPDVIAKNNMEQPVAVFGKSIQPEEILSVECKCGGSVYMTNQLLNHIPNQLSGQEGTKILLTTSDIRDSSSGLVDSVCLKYGANLIVPNVRVNDVENAIRKVAGQ